MGFFDMFDKLDDIIYKPVETICDWVREPLKRWEHSRAEETKDKEVERKINLATAERRFESEIKLREAEKQTEFQIKRETEIVRIVAEIEQFKKDKAFERFKGATEALSRFQQEFTRINVNAIWAIGEIQLELRNKAQKMVQERMETYKDFKDRAMSEAIEEIKRIEKEFGDNEKAKEILYKAVDKKLNNIIDTAQDFLKNINEDLSQLNKSIQLIAETGQQFLQKHLAQFQAFGMTEEEVKKISLTEIEHKKNRA